jgi:hypothetical protein
MITAKEAKEIAEETRRVTLEENSCVLDSIKEKLSVMIQNVASEGGKWLRLVLEDDFKFLGSNHNIAILFAQSLEFSYGYSVDTSGLHVDVLIISWK